LTITTRELQAKGMTFTCREAGSDGEPVIMLHGFPETSHMWIPLLERLTAEGYRGLAPDQRGYSPGARPEGAENYQYGDIASDVFALADAWGAERFHLVGHDWGAGAGWAAVAMNPGRIASWSALSVPHIGAFGRAIREVPEQAEKSQYITLFQQEGVADAALAANDFAALKGIWSASPPEQVAEYLRVFSQAGAITAALNWYRGSRGLDPVDTSVTFGPVDVPSLLIWGNTDMAIGRQGVENAAEFMRGPYTFVELDAGHWLIQEQPERVCDEVVEHIKANGL
jgi:pimeloyl-ACP methyl ester carboxylesterase